MFVMAKTSTKTAIVKTKYGSFKAVFEPEIDMGGYVVTAPKVQGTVSWGKNLSHAKEMIAECIEGAIEARIISEAVKEGNVRFTSRAGKMPVLA
jgi:predicted RNase H-like HicB family nuclease